ncbi:hypothetical protein VNO78_08716 [Psophocarpus tetragonolobus]|uniref:Uncharacterized protein n=1 Tax=Psophocarpus tetragonolobus TaxID=3891 RepID=A0AAN9SYF4_PSOTE
MQLLSNLMSCFATSCEQPLGNFCPRTTCSVLGVEQQTRKLGNYLQSIHDVLKDAEKKQITGHAVKGWLQKLTDAAYVLEDILDEYSLQSHELQCEEQNSCLTRLHPKDILFRHQIGKRMKDITQRFEDIDKERRLFELHHHHGGVSEKQAEDDDEWRQTSSVVTEPVVYGRDHDRGQVVEFLLLCACNNEDLCIYPIVGMGGLGKTTLAKQIFNDDRVSKHFDLTIWVCVSNDFNTKTILQSIIECSTGQNPNLNTLEAMRKKVHEVLLSKRYLLVLDDVWNEDQDKWMQLKGMLQSARGTKGSTVLVTTRLVTVASIMETHPAHHLEKLSDDDSWSLFKYHAFGPNREESTDLVKIGKDIVKKCVGSPLAIKALGTLLHGESEVTRWENVKGSEFWDTGAESSVTDFQIVKEEVIHLWMANGFIKPERNLEVEDVGNKLIVGEECVVYDRETLTHLPSRVHHLHLLESNKKVNESAFKKVESLQTFLGFVPFMHYDVKLSPLPSNSSLRAIRTSTLQLSLLMNLTHLRYLNLSRSSVRSLPNSICELQKLQILKLEQCVKLCSLPKEVTKLQDLRHVVIKDCLSIGRMPPKISKLSHLRTLSLFIVGSESGYGLEELHGLNLGGKLHIKGLENVPNESGAREANLISKKELNALYMTWGYTGNSNVNPERVLEGLEAPPTIKSFGMKRYDGIQLPNWMKNPCVLKELVEVTLYDCWKCEELPPLGKLAHLKKLYVCGMKNVKHINSESYDSVEKAFPSLEEFTVRNLPNLEGMLRQEGVEMLPRLSILSIRDASKLKLPPFPSVEFEYLHIGHIKDDVSFVERIVGNVDCLNTLSIECIKGLRVLPDQVGRLGSLQQLYIQNCDELESFPEHVFQGLTSLQYLCIMRCKKLNSLSEGVGHLGCLERVSIWGCPELVALPRNMDRLNALREVRILYNSSTLPEGLQRIPSLQNLSICGSKCTSLPDWLGDLISLRVLKIHQCCNLRSLPSTFSRLTNLRKLSIKWCPELEKWCKKKRGEDKQYMAHIPNLKLGLPNHTFQGLCSWAVGCGLSSHAFQESHVIYRYMPNNVRTSPDSSIFWLQFQDRDFPIPA